MEKIFITVGTDDRIEKAFSELKNKGKEDIAVITTTDSYDDRLEKYCSDRGIFILRFSYKNELAESFKKNLFNNYAISMSFIDVTRRGSELLAEVIRIADEDKDIWNYVLTNK